MHYLIQLQIFTCIVILSEMSYLDHRLELWLSYGPGGLRCFRCSHVIRLKKVYLNSASAVFVRSRRSRERFYRHLRPVRILCAWMQLPNNACFSPCLSCVFLIPTYRLPSLYFVQQPLQFIFCPFTCLSALRLPVRLPIRVPVFLYIYLYIYMSAVCLFVCLRVHFVFDYVCLSVYRLNRENGM